MARFDPFLHVRRAVRARARLAPLMFALAAIAAPLAIAFSVDKPSRDARPQQLADTGLYADIASHRIADDVHAYDPQYPLWSDGASKRRWIRLPPGASIDAGDPDHFVFPVGTRLWKEFSFEHRVETRMLTLGPDRKWQFATYVWSADERSAALAPDEGVPAACESAPGVPFDVPSRADCSACHEAGSNPVLGFTALQLSSDRDPLAPHARPRPSDALDLSAFVSLELVRNLPQRFVETPPRIAAATPRERAALGYLSANCGMCHSSAGALAGLELDLTYSLAKSGEPAARATAVDRPSRFRWPSDTDPRRISLAAPEHSVLSRRMASRQPLSQMPPLGTHLRDGAALELIADWIREDLAPARLAATTQSIPFDNHQDRGIQR